MQNRRSNKQKPRRSVFSIIENTVLVGLFLLVVYMLNHFMFTVPIIANVLQGLAMISVMAYAEGIVLAVGGIDFSVARNGLLSASIIYYILEMNIAGGFLAVVIALTVSMLLGLVNGIFVAKIKVQPIIATLGTTLFMRGITGAISNNIVIFGTNPELAFLKQITFGVLPVSFYVAFAILLGCYFVFQYTIIGRQVFAVGGDERSAALSGLNVETIKLFAYMAAGGIAGLGGLMIVADSTIAARFYASGPELALIFVAVIGGISMYDGSRIFFRIFIGSGILAFINQLIYTVYAVNYMRAIIIGVLFMLMVAVRKNLFRGGKGDDT